MEIRTQYETYNDVQLKVGRYAVDTSVAVQAWNNDYGPLATLTVCLHDIWLEEDEAYLDLNNCPWVIDFVERYGIGKLTGEWRRSGYCVYPKVKFDMKKLENPDLCPKDEEVYAEEYD